MSKEVIKHLMGKTYQETTDLSPQPYVQTIVCMVTN